MSSENSATVPQDASAAQGVSVPAQAKGKGKAPATDEPVDTTMDEDDDDDEEEDDEAEGGDDDDNMDEIDLSNIVEGGRRTRGRVIDWAKAAEENPAEDDDDEDEDDYEPAAPEEQGDKMDED